MRKPDKDAAILVVSGPPAVEWYHQHMFPLTQALQRGTAGLLSPVLRPSVHVHVAGTDGSKGFCGPPTREVDIHQYLRNGIPPNNLREHTLITPEPMTHIANTEELENVCASIYSKSTPLGI